ncbi:unnamed protein product [Lupinus luteus]|uniref:Uncharacterized protein n=1 Tax=Lupinus luteus TaxID=3873 RepID=A0AAV1X630_LUPLU
MKREDHESALDEVLRLQTGARRDPTLFGSNHDWIVSGEWVGLGMLTPSREGERMTMEFSKN